MTVSSENRKAGPFLGNDVATTFPFVFKVFSASDIRVVRTMPSGIEADLILDSDYSVTLNPDQDATPGGTVTFPISGDPLAEDWKLTIVGDIDALQPTDLTNGGGFYPQVIENMSDRLTMLVQQAEETIGRTLTVPVSDGGGFELPSAQTRANRVLGFDAAGGVQLVEVIDGDLVAVVKRQVFAATSGQTDFQTSFDFTPGVNAVSVFRNGSKLVLTDDYVELSANTIRLNTGSQILDAIEIVSTGLSDTAVGSIEALTSAAEADAAAAAAAADVAYAAAQASGVYIYDTRADLTAAEGSLPDLAIAEVLEDETQGGARTRYRKESGVMVFKIRVDDQAPPTSGLGDFNLDNTLHIMCGDSTTEGLQAAGGGADTAKQYRQVGGPLEKVVGMINFGGSGYTLDGFVNNAATPGFVGPSIGAEVGILQWDSWLHKPTGAISQATALAWRAQYPQYRVVWTICYGINDLILYSATGNLTQQQIVDYLAPLLREAVTRIQDYWPQDLVVLRIPNPMTFQPFAAQFPSPSAYPNFDTPGFEATSRALVEKWNQALRQTYRSVQSDFSRTVLMDTWEDVFGNSDTTLTAATQLPYLGDRVHPSNGYNGGYAGIAKSYIKLVAPKYKLVTPRLVEADSRATLLANNPWDNYPGYFQNNPRYKLIIDTTISSVGVNYIDLEAAYTLFQKQVSGPIYIAIEGVAAQYFATYSAAAAGNNTRLTGVAPTTALQAGKGGFKATIYQDNGVILLANDVYVDGQVKTAKEAFPGAISSAGNGFIRITLSAVNGRLSTAFMTGVLFGKLAVGGTVGQVLDFTAGGWTVIQAGGSASARILQFNKAGTDYSTWVNQPAALFFSDTYPSPKSYEDVVVSGTTDASAGTQSAHAHGLGYTPKRVQLLPKGNGVIYQSAAPDATNIYVKGSANSLTFDAYVK